MKSLIDFYRSVAADAATWCCTSASDYDRMSRDIERDIAYLRRRIEGEGMEFFTITLSTFRKDFERSLEVGRIADEAFVGFRKGPHRSSKSPLYCGWLLQLIFNAETGALLDVVNTDAVRGVRQLTGLFDKIELECSDARKIAALATYIETDKEVRHNELGEIPLAVFHRVGNLLFSSILRSMDHRARNREMVGRHGPGKTADKLTGNRKWTQPTWTWRLEEAGVHYMDFAALNDRHYYVSDSVHFLEPGEEQPVKVVLVPKTLKTPRVIAEEPTAMQFVQQAVARDLYRFIEAAPDIGEMIHFRDQEPNRASAREGSIFGHLATLDLSEASDRVSNQLVLELFRDYSAISGVVQACRSTRADVPGFGVISLSKYASMGSALTFPIEAMVFLTVIFVGIESAIERRLTAKDISALSRQVRVYGDDLIVPTDFVPSVIQALEDFGLKVNVHKSFWLGKFRESCGKEYYNGDDVSYVKLRNLFPRDRRDVSSIVSAIDTRNQFFANGYWKSAAFMDQLLERVLRHYPVVGPRSTLLGKHSSLIDKLPIEMMDPDLHVPIRKGWTVRAVIPVNAIDGHAALMKCLTSRGNEPFEDPEHLQRSGRPRVVSIKLAKAPVY